MKPVYHVSMGGCFGNNTIPRLVEYTCQLNDVNSCVIHSATVKWIILKPELQVGFWKTPTVEYMVQFTPSHFILASKDLDSLDFCYTIKSYLNLSLKYRPIYLVYSLLYWANSFGYLLWQNMYLLISFSETPNTYCKRLNLELHRSVYYKHDFIVAFSECTFPLNCCSAGFVEYHEHVCLKICWMCSRKKYHSVSYLTSILSGGSHSCSKNIFEFSPNSVSNSTAHEYKVLTPIGGGYSHAEVLRLSDINSFIISSSIEYTEFDSFAYVDHLEISNAKEKYQDAQVVMCNISLHLLVPKLLLQSLHNIARQHNVFLSCKLQSRKS